MPIDIRRFGVGHRRPDGPPGTTLVSGQVIESGPLGAISELAFARGARIEPHTNPNPTWLVVIEGGGWVGVGEDRTRIAAGEAAFWPADVPHAAWTEHSQMRAFVIEFAGSADDADALLEGTADGHRSLGTPVERGVGHLIESERPPRADPEAGEPA
jgi:quercetin dioxygenase-like cupin family protein